MGADRAQYDSVRSVVVLDVIDQVEKLCERRHLTCLVQRVHDAGAVQCSPALVEALTAAVKESEEVCNSLHPTPSSKCECCCECLCE